MLWIQKQWSTVRLCGEGGECCWQRIAGGYINHSFATTVSRLKMCDFSGVCAINFLWVRRRHNCSPAASFANYVMTLYPLKVHLQAFLSIPVTEKFQILICDTRHKWAIWTIYECVCVCVWERQVYFLTWGPGTSSARPGRKQATATKL